MRFQEPRAHQLTRPLRGSAGGRRTRGPGRGRGWALRPRCGGTSSCARGAASTPARSPLPLSPHHHPPPEELTVPGAAHKAPCTPRRPRSPGGRSPSPFPPPARGPKLPNRGRSERRPAAGGVSGASLGNSSSSLFLTPRAPDRKGGAGGVPSLGLPLAFCDSHPSRLSGACNRGLTRAYTYLSLT